MGGACSAHWENEKCTQRFGWKAGRREDKIKMVLGEIVLGGMNWIICLMIGTGGRLLRTP
jgi:hypothetical protein